MSHRQGHRPPALDASATEHLVELAGEGPGRLLELGSGGIHAPGFALAGWQVVVAEAQPDRLGHARERAGEVAEIVTAVEGVLPFPDGFFDVVVGRGTAEARRVLRPGGRLLP